MPTDGSVPLQTLLLSNPTPTFNTGLFIVLLVLIIVSAFFAATETAFSCANRIKLRSLAVGGNKRAEKVLHLAEENYDKFISSVLVGNNIVNIVATTIATIFFAQLITNGSSELISTIVMTVAVLIFGEITPKFIAKTYPEKISMLFYPLIMFFYYLLSPINLFFGAWKWLLSKVLRLKNVDVVTEDEIMTIVEEAEEDGTLKTEETKLIRSVIEFDDLEVRDILVPRVNVVAVNVDDSMEEIKKVFEKQGYSRIPVYRENIDTIIGVIHQKDFFNAYVNGKKGIDGILKDTLFTTEFAKISDLLRQLQKKKKHLAIVLDEYGGTLGLVTMEDIIEELVGEIYDEHDEEVNYFKQIEENVYVVDGNANIHDAFEFFSLVNDEKIESTTVSGWIIEMAGEIPTAGKKLEYKHLDLEVTKSTVRKILQVRVTITNRKDEAETEEE